MQGVSVYRKSLNLWWSDGLETRSYLKSPN